MVVGYTDDSLKLYDMRMNSRNESAIELEGGHSDMIKAVKLH